jgi:hypothetical protein
MAEIRGSKLAIHPMFMVMDGANVVDAAFTLEHAILKARELGFEATYNKATQAADRAIQRATPKREG